MNIFFLDKNPTDAAKAPINKHVVKMVLESAQLLSAAHRIVDGSHYIDSSSGRRLQRWAHPDKDKDEVLYVATHFNHPCAVWLRESRANYDWLYEHFIALGQEYKKRYGRTHLSITKLADVLQFAPKNIPNVGFTEPTQAMPEAYRVKGDVVAAYRNYYEAEKLDIGTEGDRDRYFHFVINS